MLSKSILLNFSTRLNVEESDPLIALARGQGNLLFSDRLSVGHFPSDPAEAVERQREIIVQMRGLLESRTLSSDDRDETFRLIFLLDLSEEEFAAQRVRSIRQMIRDIFGEHNILLRRFRYLFIFTDDEGEAKTNVFRIAALKGMGATGWITSDSLKLNELKAECCKLQWSAQSRNERSDGSGDREEGLLDDGQDLRATLGTLYNNFHQRFMERIAHVRKMLDKVRCGNEFEERAARLLAGISTVGVLRNTDFDEELKKIIGNQIGLCSDEFRKDCLFFIVNIKTSPISVWRVCDIYIKSLVLFLASLSEDDFEKRLAQFNENDPATLYSAELPREDIVNYGELSRLQQVVASAKTAIKDLHRKESSSVKCKNYTLNDDYDKAVYDQEYLEARESRRKNLDDAMMERMFFGVGDNDRTWYDSVAVAMNEMKFFEEGNLRPHIVEPRRITDADIQTKEQEVTYDQLRAEIETTKVEQREENAKATVELEDLSALRHRYLGDIESLESEALGTMKHLGVVNRIVLSAVGVVLMMVLCFILHFMGFESFDAMQTIVALLAATALTALSVFVPGMLLKHKVKKQFDAIRQKYELLDQVTNSYLEKYNARIYSRNMVEVLQKRLDEMHRIYDDFDGHNKRVDLWFKYYTDMKKALDNQTGNRNENENENENEKSASKIDASLIKTNFPILPLGYILSYNNGPVRLCDNVVFEKATSFITNFRMTKN